MSQQYRVVVLSSPTATGDEAQINKLANDGYEVVAITPGYVGFNGSVMHNTAIMRRTDSLGGWASIFGWVGVVLAVLAAAVVAMQYGVR